MHVKSGSKVLKEEDATKREFEYRWQLVLITLLIIKITISSSDWFKKLLFPTNSCYRTVQQTNQIQICSLNQPITFKVVV